MSRDAFDAAATAAASKATYTGATAATLGWVASSEFSVIAGLLIAALGLLTNLYFQFRRDRREAYEQLRREQREEREHQRRMEKLQTDRGDLTP